MYKRALAQYRAVGAQQPARARADSPRLATGLWVISNAVNSRADVAGGEDAGMRG